MEKDRHSIECLSFFVGKSFWLVNFEVGEREFREISEFREKPYRPYYP